MLCCCQRRRLQMLQLLSPCTLNKTGMHTLTHMSSTWFREEAAVGDTRKKGRGRKDAQRDLVFVRQKGNEVKYICVVLCFVVAKWCKFGFTQRRICKTADWRWNNKANRVQAWPPSVSQCDLSHSGSFNRYYLCSAFAPTAQIFFHFPSKALCFSQSKDCRKLNKQATFACLFIFFVQTFPSSFLDRASESQSYHFGVCNLPAEKTKLLKRRPKWLVLIDWKQRLMLAASGVTERVLIICVCLSVRACV